MFFTHGEVITETTFPDGTKNISGFKLGKKPLISVFFPPDQMMSNLLWKWESDEDLITLMLLKKCYPGFQYLTILYLPYGREDRDISGGSKCSLRYICEFIKGLNFRSIEVVDPHSDLTLAYLGENAFGSYPKEHILSALGKLSLPLSLETKLAGHGKSPVHNYVVMFPDAGAQKRYGKIWSEFPQIVGVKNRDFATGKITSYSVINGELAKGKEVIIIDDICSYGGTFMAAAQTLKAFHPKRIILAVTHCENSILKGDLLKPHSPVDHVIITDSLFSDLAYLYPQIQMTIIPLTERRKNNG